MKEIIIPIKCFTCGALVADKWDKFASQVKLGKEPGTVLDSLSVKKYCCRRMLQTHSELIDEVMGYSMGVSRKVHANND